MLAVCLDLGYRQDFARGWRASAGLTVGSCVDDCECLQLFKDSPS